MEDSPRTPITASGERSESIAQHHVSKEEPPCRIKSQGINEEPLNQYLGIRLHALQAHGQVVLRKPGWTQNQEITMKENRRHTVQLRNTVANLDSSVNDLDNVLNVSV